MHRCRFVLDSLFSFFSGCALGCFRRWDTGAAGLQVGPLPLLVSCLPEVAVPAGLSTLGSTQVAFSSAFPLLLVPDMCVQRLGDFISASFPVSILMLRPVWQPAASTSRFQRKQNLLRSPSRAVLIISDQGGWGEFCECWKAPSLLTWPHLVIILALGSLQSPEQQAGGTLRSLHGSSFLLCSVLAAPYLGGKAGWRERGKFL